MDGQSPRVYSLAFPSSRLSPLSERLKQAIRRAWQLGERLYRKGILHVNRPQFSQPIIFEKLSAAKNLQAAGGDQEPPNPNPHPKIYRIPPGLFFGILPSQRRGR